MAPARFAVAAPLSPLACGRLLLPLLLACAHPAGAAEPTVAPRFVLSDSAATPAPAGDGAIIRLVREQYVRQRPLPPEMIYLDGGPAGLLPQQSWFELDVKPGPHRLCGLAGDTGLTLRCDPRRTYLLRLREVVDSEDQLTARWLLDDPGVSKDLVRKSRLRHVTTTQVGLRYLEKKKRTICPDDDPSVAPSRARALPDSFDNILLERPLDQVNLETDFSQLSGRVLVDTAGIHYRLRAQVRSSLNTWRLVTDSLDVPVDSIVGVRYGGTRFTGVNPWLDVYHTTSAGLRIASFADTREANGTWTYNRIFETIEDLRSTRGQGGSPTR